MLYYSTVLYTIMLYYRLAALSIFITCGQEEGFNINLASGFYFKLFINCPVLHSDYSNKGTHGSSYLSYSSVELSGY